LQHEIQDVSGRVDVLKRDTEHGIDNLTKSLGDLSEEMSTRVNAHIVQTRKELDKQGQKIITSSKVLLANIREHKAETESNVANLRQAINQNREEVDGLLNSMSGEVRTSIQECESQIQSVKHTNESEKKKLNKAVSSLEAKIMTGLANNNRSAILQTAVIRTTGAGQPESTVVAVGSESSVNSVNGANACDMSTCSDGANAPSASVNTDNNNVNAGSRLYANNTDLSELSLPTFTDSTSQVPLHFIWDLDQYFSLKRTPEELRLALVFQVVKEPFAKQWLSSVFDKTKNYDEFEKAFTELLWCPSRQASIRSAIYLDKHDSVSGESCLDHYIRHANMASTLNPPMSDLDLLSALTSHFELQVQQGLICSNMQSTQDALAFLAKLQGLGDHRQTFRSPRREFDRRDSNRRQTRDQDNARNRDRGNGVNVWYVRQNDRRNRGLSDRTQQGEGSRSFHRHGQGSMREDRGSQLNPIAPNFHLRNPEPPRSQDSRLGARTADSNPPTLNH
jgi:hypothetical protein